MATEIERKYLVNRNEQFDSILTTLSGNTFHQMYLSLDPERTVRVRIDETAHQAWVTIKGHGNGLSRPEFEYSIPESDAQAMMSLAVTALSKTRYRYFYEGYTFEIDVFHGRHDGLILVEVELNDEKEQPLLPEWVGQEVTHIKNYSNAALSQQ